MGIYTNRFRERVFDLEDLKRVIDKIIKKYGNLEIRGAWDDETAMVKVYENDNKNSEEIYVKITSDNIED